MCVYSMIMDHYWDKWKMPQQPVTTPQPLPTIYPYAFPTPPQPIITPAEIEEFKKLLERAREYDKKHGQPDCELEEKRRKLKDLAETLGVDISFV